MPYRRIEPYLWKPTTTQLGEDKVRVLRLSLFVVPKTGKR